MYEAEDDPYCYPGTSVLKNLGNARIQSELDKLEAVMVKEQSLKPLPRGALDERHYRAIHRHLFRYVYAWAGRYRTVRMTRAGSQFCNPHFIAQSMQALFSDLETENQFRDLPAAEFAGKAAHFLSELNAIHPFREGNGRTQNVFLDLLAYRAGHPLDLSRLEPAPTLHAMITAFQGDEQPLAALIRSMMRGR